MATLFSADNHFGHENIIRLSDRPFEDAEDMDEVYVSAWNETVGAGDTVYHLGDFALGGPEMAERYLLLLNGHVKMVPGGHDSRWIDAARSGKLFTKDGPVEVLDKLAWLEFPEYSEDGKHPLTVVLCHYPLWEWERKHYGALHLHGHVHGRPTGLQGRILDVGVDVFTAPVSLEEIIGRLIGVRKAANGVERPPMRVIA